MITILWASPNDDGLTAACVEAAQRGVKAAGYACDTIALNNASIGMCRACGNGWGTCREQHECCVQDGFQAVHHMVRQAEAVIAVTPVYWGDMAESAKCFFDRLRRCEALLREAGTLHGRDFLAVAAAGGSGNGTITTLAQFERLAGHLGMRFFDGIPVKRFTRLYQLDTVERAAAALAAAVRTGAAT